MSMTTHPTARERLRPGARFPDVDCATTPATAGGSQTWSRAIPPCCISSAAGGARRSRRSSAGCSSCQDDAEVAYARMISVSVDPPEVNAAFRAGLGARWTFLSDPDRAVQERFGLRETTDTVNDPYVPAVFTLFPDLTIHRSYNGYWYWGRPTLDELRQDLRHITRAIRSDWEAPTP